jgi:hypothetical protein
MWKTPETAQQTHASAQHDATRKRDRNIESSRIVARRDIDFMARNANDL